MKGSKSHKICFQYQNGLCTREVCKFSHDQQSPSPAPQKMTARRESSSQSHLETPFVLKRRSDISQEPSPQSIASREAAEVRDLIRDLARKTDEQLRKTGEQLRKTGEQTDARIDKLSATVQQLTQYTANRDKDVELQACYCVRDALQATCNKVDEIEQRTLYRNDEEGSEAVEWDGIINANDEVLYVVEVKQHIAKEHIDDIQRRLDVTRTCITDTTPIHARNVNIRTKIASQRAFMASKDFSIKAVVGGNNVTDDMKSYIESQGYLALYPNGKNWSVSMMRK